MLKNLYQEYNAKIKLLELNDLLLMKDIVEDDDMRFDFDNLKNFISQQNNYGFIAKLENVVVGFAYGYALLRPDGKTMFYLHSIGILSKYQGKGIGSKLMSYILNFSKNNGFSELFVITDKGNFKACNLYEKFGGKNDYEDEIVYVYDFIKK